MARRHEDNKTEHADNQIDYGEVIELDLEKRKARRNKKFVGRTGREEEGRGWREKVAEAGRGLGIDVEKIKRDEERRKQTREAAAYSNLRAKYDQGILEEEALVDFLKTYPSAEEYEAHQRLNDAIGSGEVGEEISELKKESDEEKTVRTRVVTQRIREPKKGGWVERKKIVEVQKRGGAAVAIPSEESGQTVEEWYRKLLREYALGELTKEDVGEFLSSFSPEEKRARARLFGEIRERRKSSKLNREEVEEMLMRGMGFREELIKDIPTEEGKTLFEEMLEDQIEIFKGVMLDTVSRADYEKKMEEAGGDREKAERELIREAAKKFLAVKELFTHGVMGYDRKNGRIVLNRYSDLDGKCAMALLGKAGLDISKVGYLTPGEIKQGQVTFDSGNRDGLVTETVETVDPKTGERKKEISTIFDHHGPYSDRGTSATESVYKFLTELGLLKFKDETEQKNYDKVVDWVTESDNFSFSDMEKYFQTSDRRMIGFVKFRNFDQLLKFARSGKELTDLLTDEELRQFGLIYKDGKTGKIVDRPAERREVIKETLETVRELGSKGWAVATKDGKRFLVDTQGKLGGEGQWAAASLGYAGIVRYTPEVHGFLAAQNKGTFDEKIFEDLPQGKLMRDSMFLHPMGQEKLVVTLGDLLGKLAPGFEPGSRTELKKFLDAEPRRIRAVVSRAPEGWWWTNAPDGKKVVARGLPPDFKSGQEAYLILRKPKEPTNEEKIKYGGDFYIGFWESDEIILPKKVEVKAPAKAETKPEAPKAPPEKELSPAERERKDKEKKFTEAVVAEEKRIFNELLQQLEASPFYGKWDAKRREDFARAQIKPLVGVAKKELREKYRL